MAQTRREKTGRARAIRKLLASFQQHLGRDRVTVERCRANDWLGCGEAALEKRALHLGAADESVLPVADLDYYVSSVIQTKTNYLRQVARLEKEFDRSRRQIFTAPMSNEICI